MHNINTFFLRKGGKVRFVLHLYANSIQSFYLVFAVTSKSVVSNGKNIEEISFKFKLGHKMAIDDVEKKKEKGIKKYAKMALKILFCTMILNIKKRMEMTFGFW